MAVTNFTTLLGLALPTTGDLSGTWGDTVNDAITELLDTAVAGTTTLSADADVTLSTTNGAANQARSAVIVWDATGSVTRNITAPAQSKAYIVINKTGGTQDIVIRGAGPTTGVTISAGYEALVAWDGADFVEVAGGVTDVAHGGTGANTLTLNNVLLGNGTSAVQFVAPGTSGNVLTSNGTTWASAVVPPGGLVYTVKTANYTAVDKEGILADTSGGSFTVTLPATPSTGDQVVVADPTGDWGTNSPIVGRNGSTIAGLAQDMTLDIAGASVQFVYDGTTWAVYAQVGGNGGTVVTLTGTQTLTNKTLTSPILTGPTINDGYTEEVFAVTGTTPALSPTNGSIQTWALTATSTPTAGTWASGQSMTLMIDDTVATTVNWGSVPVTWVGGSAPTLPTSGYGVIELWKVSTTVYGASVGDVA